MNSTPSAAAAAGPPGSAAIATGNVLTTRAAARVLRAGGNAVDAAVAAGFTSAVCEPGLASIAGGGFLTLRTPAGDTSVLDFFTTVPGLGGVESDIEATTITVVYPAATQDFRVGAPSAAVPGCLSGWLAVHADHGRLPLPEVMAPSVELAAAGAEIDSSQSYIMGLIEDILRFSPESRELFVPEGELLAEGDLLFAPDLAAFLASVAAGEIDALDSPGFAGPLLRLGADGCRITADDLADYEPVWRHPLQSQHNGWRVDTNPAPAFGGQIIAAALRSVDGSGPAAMTAALRDATAAAKNGDAPLAVTGTTQISIADADGMVVSMTTTNGAGGGVMVPDTGIHLNNMLGEDDLLPGGLATVVPGARLRSMAAPSLLTDPEGGVVALGSGGSARIRSAITSVILRLSDSGEDLASAVTGPRAHLEDGGMVQVEPGFSEDEIAELGRGFPVNVWDRTDFYFGGVNAVQRHADGSVEAAADHRRNGSVAIVAPG